MNIDKRIEKLRNLMKDRKIEAYIIPSSDPHQSEYLADHYKTREYITGFDGSAGTAIITTTEAKLWTDSRYFLQAENQLKNSEFELMKIGDDNYPTIEKYLEEKVSEFGKIGFDGEVYSVSGYKKLSDNMGARILISDIDYISDIWKDRPDLPKDKIWILDDEITGESLVAKLTRVRQVMEDNDYDYYFIGSPEDICYLLNIRGNDVEYNPVVLSYMLISKDKASLFIDKEKIDETVRKYLEDNHISIYSYGAIYEKLNEIKGKNRIFLDPNRTNVSVYDAINSNVKISQGSNITTLMKAIKTDRELENIRKAYLIDGATLVRFFNRVEIGASTNALNEFVASKKLHDLRMENETYIEDSFGTIAGYKENAAIVHYAPSNVDSKTLRSEGMLLVDSGAHYKEGTTDITRTVALGRLTEEEKIDYTLVLKSHISLFTAQFKDKTTGARLDSIAKLPLWKEGKDYFHGTGHGVGFILTVHEGPQSLSAMGNVSFEENMTSSIEPGLYIAGSHGIRIESEAYVKFAYENEFGRFMKFENLTYVPIDTRPIKLDMLSIEEIDWLNSYNAKCEEVLSPYLEGSDLDYLKERCKAI